MLTLELFQVLHQLFETFRLSGTNIEKAVTVKSFVKESYKGLYKEPKFLLNFKEKGKIIFKNM